MRGWDLLLDRYPAEYQARGICDSSVGHATSVLERWGRWMRTRRPRPRLEQIDAELTMYDPLRSRPGWSR